MKGTLALDIDGTVTTSHRTIPQEIIDCLEQHAKNGWDIVFVTGRPFFHCVHIFQRLEFPFYIAPQNGAALVAMPDRLVVKKRYLNQDIIPKMEEICSSEETDFVVYSGLENHDCVFFRPGGFSAEMREYLGRRTRQFGEDWQGIGCFSRLDLPEFASVKCFAKEAQAQRLAKKMEEQLSLQAPIITDPFDSDYRVIQGTHPDVNKGQAVRDLLELRGSQALPIIAAGDDNNDVTLLKAATVRIVMETAPESVRELADITAETAAHLGLIPALEEAVARVYTDRASKIGCERRQSPGVERSERGPY